MPEKVLRHFKKNDPALYGAIRSFTVPLTDGPEISSDLFSSLCRIIVGQQLSGKAARAIWEKFRIRFPRNKPTAIAILKMTDVQLRGSGLSFAKIRSLKDLSERTKSRSLRLSALSDMGEAEASKKLQEVKGIGPWSAEMFLMFSLGHEDVFSYGDLGLQKGIQKLYNLEELPSDVELDTITKKWSPYRTYAARALWHLVDTKV